MLLMRKTGTPEIQVRLLGATHRVWAFIRSRRRSAPLQ
jgi:hypothetical protein